MLGKNRFGQSTAEYAILIALIVAVAVGMQTYVKRGLQGRFKDTSDDYVGSVETGYKNITDGDMTANMDSTATLSAQYEPEGLTSKSTQQIIAENETSTMEKGGTVTRQSLRRSKQGKGDYQKYDY